MSNKQIMLRRGISAYELIELIKSKGGVGTVTDEDGTKIKIEVLKSDAKTTNG